MKFFLSIILTIVLGAQKNHLIETVLLSTHNICFDACLKSAHLHTCNKDHYLMGLPKCLN